MRSRLRDLSDDDRVSKTYFGDVLNIKYIDRAASTETGKMEAVCCKCRSSSVRTSRRHSARLFNDENAGCRETKFPRSGKLFCGVQEAIRKSDGLITNGDDLEAGGRRILREVMEDIKSAVHPRIRLLLGQFDHEMISGAKRSIPKTVIVRQYPENHSRGRCSFKRPIVMKIGPVR